MVCVLHNNERPILELPKTVQQQAAATLLARSCVAGRVGGYLCAVLFSEVQRVQEGVYLRAPFSATSVGF